MMEHMCWACMIFADGQIEGLSGFLLVFVACNGKANGFTSGGEDIYSLGVAGQSVNINLFKHAFMSGA
ncbi:MAG: hypothetical protein ACLFP8_03700 [Alphaproteobacteria bacterium]